MTFPHNNADATFGVGLPASDDCSSVEQHLDRARAAQRATAQQLAGVLAPLFAPDQVIGLVALGYSHSDDHVGHTMVGYFNAANLTDLADNALAFTTSAAGVYATMNPLAPTVADRSPGVMRTAGHGTAAANGDVTGRRWLLIDIDPVRPAGIPATDAERAAAKTVAAAVVAHLSGYGWPEPVVSDTGNGVHLLYRVDLPAEDGGLVQRVLTSLADRMDTADAKIDRVVHNAARLLRLPGTLNRKGPATANRPHRPCRLVSMPIAPTVVTRQQLEAVAGPAVPTEGTESAASVGDAVGARPGTDFDRRGTWAQTGLFDAGWTWHQKTGDDAGTITRPGKTGGASATVGTCARSADGVPYLYSFSDNGGPIPANEPLTRFGVFARLKHGGDFAAAAAALRQMGYGATTDKSANPAVPTGDRLVPVSAADLLARHPDHRPPVIQGLLREGETMNLIAPPKFGKSFLALGLGCCVAAGRDWLGHRVEGGRVLLVDNELHPETLAARLRHVARALGIDQSVLADRLDVVPLRGRLRDLKGLDAGLAHIAPGKYRLLVLDAWYRLQPDGGDENANGHVTGLYNLLDQLALRMGVATVCIHHASKGNQSNKGVTDVGSGAGSMSRAADTHAVLRRHEEDDHVVLEGATRSWPQPDPVVLKWTFPTFAAVSGLDPAQLDGRKAGGKAKKEATVEHVRQAVAASPRVGREALIKAVVAATGCSETKAAKIVKEAATAQVIVNATTAANKPAVYTLPATGDGGDAPAA